MINAVLENRTGQIIISVILGITTTGGNDMKVNRDKLIEKLANQATDAADMDSMISYFYDGQVAFLEDMTDNDLIQYANDILGYDVEEEGV